MRPYSSSMSQVAILQRHKNLVDQLNFNPNLPRRFYTVPDLRNRYVQVVAPVGDLLFSYSAEVDLDVHRADPATVHEMDVRDLPLDILPYLLPSRFVPSDRLANFAMREFAAVPKGTRGSARFARGSTRISNIDAAAATPRRRPARF